ncbi:MAG TPA: hypothetical protein VHU84_01185, partial [Lacipirellulaceae bacterium]|nr:hypothetical protein [Lacipirellulaceae bacterium]
YDALASLHETRLRDAAAKRPSSDSITQAMKQLYKDLAVYQDSHKDYVSKREDVRTEFNELPKLLPTGEAKP